MADISSLQNLDQQFGIVDPNTGRPSDYFMRYLFDRQGYLTEADQELATILARQIIAGDGLTGGGELGDGDVTLNADAQAILDLITTTQGSILYRGADAWAALAPGTSGQFLKTNGAGANPEWATPAGGGGGTWTLLDSWNHAVDGTIAALDVDVTSCDEVQVICRDVSLSSSGYRGVFLSVDGGVSFYNSSGDYVWLSATGTEGSDTNMMGHSSSTTAARSVFSYIHSLRASGVMKAGHQTQGQIRYFLASQAPVTHIRVAGTAGDMTGGTIQVLGR